MPALNYRVNILGSNEHSTILTNPLPKFGNGSSLQTLSYKSQLIENVELLHKQQTKFEYDIFICFSTKERELARQIWETLRGFCLRIFVSDDDLQNKVGK